MVKQFIRPIAMASLFVLCLACTTSCFERFQHKDVEVANQASSAEAPAAEEEKPDEKAAPAKDEGASEEEEVKLIQFTPEQLKQHGVAVIAAGPADLSQTLTVPGEVAVNADRLAHVLPPMTGTIKQLTKNIGDHVKAGELLAVLDSREMTEAKSTYLSALEEVRLAQANYDREEKLYAKGISAKTEFINADNALTQAKINLRESKESLGALGVSAKQIAALSSASDTSLSRYNVYAPISGRIMEKQASLGQMAGMESELYLIADLSSVWVNLSVSQKDLGSVREGQHVTIKFNPSTGDGTATAGNSTIPDAQGKVKYIDALVAEDTRSATARVVLPNPHGVWRPGMFVSGLLNIGSTRAAIVVPRSAVIPYEGNSAVFVEKGETFEPHAVTLGRQTDKEVEVLTGLSAGDLVVSNGTFMVKADLGKSEASEE